MRNYIVKVSYNPAGKGIEKSIAVILAAIKKGKIKMQGDNDEKKRMLSHDTL